MARTSIQADLGLDTTRFQRGLAKSQKGIKNFVSNGIKQFGALAGAAGFGMLARSAFQMATNIANLSKVANSGQEEFQKFAFGAKTVGVDMEKTADILKDTSDKIGDFLQTGGGPLADFFENIAPKIGVTAEMFRDLSGPQALQLYVSSLEKANLSQNEMTFFMEAIASDATLLLPLLQDNAQAMTQLGRDAEALGVIMKTSTVKQLNAATVELNKLKTQATVLTGSIISRVVPAFAIFGHGLGGVGEIVGGMISKFASFFTFLSRSLGIVIAPAVQAFAALSAGIEGALQAAALNPKEAKAAIEKSTKLAKQAFETLKDIPNEMAANYKRANEEMELDNRSVEKSMKERADSIEKNWALMTGNMVEETKKGAKEIDEINEKLSKTEKDRIAKAEAAAARIALFKAKELEVIKLRAKGENEAADAIERKIRLGEKAITLSKKHGITIKEAMKLVQDTIDNAPDQGGGSGSGGGSGGGSADEIETPVTGRDKRAAEAAARKQATADRRAMTARVAEQSGANQRNRDLLLGSVAKPDPKNKGIEKNASKQTTLLESIEREIKRNP